MVKYHIGRNGPAVCRANPDKPGGRPCRYGDNPHGDQDEIQAIWEKQMDGEFGLTGGVKKSKSSEKDLAEGTKSTLSNITKYESSYYDSNSKNIAMRLGLTNISPLAYIPVKKEDTGFRSEGFSTTQRLELENGDAGYFKPFIDNTDMEYMFEQYGETSLGAAINEVNSYRLSQAMGNGYDKLVPETVIREYEGRLGSFQCEAEMDNDAPKAKDFGDQSHKAAVFDFAVGNLDRHGCNWLRAKQKGTKENNVVLIDNSFAFSRDNISRYSINQTLFTARHDGSAITDDDRVSLQRASTTIDEWVKDGTIHKEQAEAAQSRINYLLESGCIRDFDDWFGEKDGDDDWGF